MTYADEEVEKLAREFATLWRYEGVCDFAEGNLKFSEYAEAEVHRRLARAFYAGFRKAQELYEERGNTAGKTIKEGKRR